MGIQTLSEEDRALLGLRTARAEALHRRKILLERDLYMGSFKAFVRAVWSAVMLPGKPMLWNWHLDVICEMLEAVHAGEINRLLINVPPRSSKTTIISICFPIWKWLHDPAHQFLCTAHSGKKARSDAVKARNVIQSAWFQERFGDIFHLAADVNAKERYETNHNGHRLSYGMTTMLAGENADTIIIDDPHDPDSVQSDAKRATVLDNYDDSISQRLNDPATGAIIIVMQRLHQQDLCGHVLANADKGEWVHLCFPQEYEPNHPFLSDICRKLDPRKKTGQLLWEARFPVSYLKKRRKTMTALGYSGQHQQRPTPASGAILKPEWWRIWTGPMPEIEFVLHSWDTAYSEEGLKKNARSALTSWGVFWHEQRGRWCVLLLRGYAKHLEYPELRRIAKKITLKDKPDMVLVEKKASGISLIQDFHRAGIAAVKYNPDRDKIARAYSIQAMLESGQVYYLEGKRWAQEVIEECGAFPYGLYKDYADTMSQALIRLRNMELFQHPDDQDEDEDDAVRRRRGPTKERDDDDTDDTAAYG